jgi:hypothetical protein
MSSLTDELRKKFPQLITTHNTDLSSLNEELNCLAKIKLYNTQTKILNDDTATQLIFLDIEFLNIRFTTVPTKNIPFTKTTGMTTTTTTYNFIHENNVVKFAREIGIIILEKDNGDWKLKSYILLNVPIEDIINPPKYTSSGSPQVINPMYSTVDTDTKTKMNEIYKNLQKLPNKTTDFKDDYSTPDNIDKLFKLYTDDTQSRTLNETQFNEFFDIVKKYRNSKTILKGQNDEIALNNTFISLDFQNINKILGRANDTSNKSRIPYFYNRFDIVDFNKTLELLVGSAKLDDTYAYCMKNLSKSSKLNVINTIETIFNQLDPHNPIYDNYMTFVVLMYIFTNLIGTSPSSSSSSVSSAPAPAPAPVPVPAPAPVPVPVPTPAPVPAPTGSVITSLTYKNGIKPTDSLRFRLTLS